MAPQGNPLLSIFPLVVVFLIFYFIVIGPSKREEKERKKMLAGLNKNDEVVTSAGIHGTIVNLKDKTVILRVDDNVKIEIEKSCVTYVKKG